MSQRSDISVQRLAQLAAAYGADVSRWPSVERMAASRLLADSADARACVDASRELDCAMSDLPVPPPPSAQLRARILAAAPIAAATQGPARQRGWFWEMCAELGGFRRIGPVFASSLALGVLLAVLQPPPTSIGIDEDSLDSVVWSDADYQEMLP